MSIFLTDTTLTLNTKFKIDNQGYNLDNTDWIELQNASPFACKVQVGSSQILVPAWYDYPIPCALYNNVGTRRILPGLSFPFFVTPYLQTIPGSGFTQTLHTILYLNGESPSSTTPQPLGGSPVDLSVATSVVNTNDPSGTVEVFLIPHGDANPAGATRILNNAEIILGDAANVGTLSLLENGGDSFLLQANGWTQTDSAGANVSTLDDTGIFSVGSANHNGAVQITGSTLVSLIMNIASGLLIAGTAGTTVTQLDTAGRILGAGNIALDLSAGDGTVALPQLLKSNVAATSHSGSVNGNAQLSVPIWGTALKIVILTFNAYQSAASFTFSLPGTLSQALWMCGNIGAETVTPQLTGVASTVSVITVLNAAGGTSAGQNPINKNSIGELGGACNQLLISSNAAQVSRQLILIGV